MTNRPKRIGTSGETALVRYLRANGMPLADRLALHGSKDIGDVGDGTGSIIFEVKSGKAAENAGDQKIADWIEETQTEQDNARADWGILVVKRAGYGDTRVGKWWAIVRGPLTLGGPWLTQRFLLEELVLHLRDQGYGDPLD